MSNLKLVKNLVKKKRPNWPEPTKLLGAGVNGRVYELNNGRLLKLIYANAPKEYEMLKILQSTHKVPSFKNGNSWRGKLTFLESRKLKKNLFPNSNKFQPHLTMFIMGRVGSNGNTMSLHRYMMRFPGYNKTTVQNRVENLVKQMHLKGISHGNLHSENIMVTVDSAGRMTGMWVIDFGRSRKFPLNSTEYKIGNKLWPGNVSKVFNYIGTPGYANVQIWNRTAGLARHNSHMVKAHFSRRIARGTQNEWAKRRREVHNEMASLPSVRRAGPVKSRSLSALVKPKTPSPKPKTPSPKKPSPKKSRLSKLFSRAKKTLNYCRGRTSSCTTPRAPSS